jgi:predicted transcriptional regulator of viral defense system
VRCNEDYDPSCGAQEWRHAFVCQACQRDVMRPGSMAVSCALILSMRFWMLARLLLIIGIPSYSARKIVCSRGKQLAFGHDVPYTMCTIVCFMGKLMRANHKPNLKTSRSRMASLLTALYDSARTTFTTAEAARITGLTIPLASSLLHKARKRGLISRLKRGLFVIVPPELGSSSEYSGNPYLIARYLVGDAPYFLSHATAMELHRMVTQPQFVIFVSTTKRILRQTLHGTEFRFVLTTPKHFFGSTKHWVTKQDSVEISDLERTVLDGLRHPELCGGITDVAKGFWMRHADVRVTKLLDYAKRLGIGSVNRRLGYLLEVFGFATEAELQSLRKALTATYAPLDPSLPSEGPHLAKWRLQLNVPAEELLAVRST